MWCGELGFEPDGFWKQTPRSLQAIIESKNRRAMQELDRVVYAEYLNASLQRVKKMPKLKDVLPSSGRSVKQSTPQSWEAMLLTAKSWAALTK